MSETSTPSQQPGKEDGEEKQGSPQQDGEHPPEKDAPTGDGSRTDAVRRNPRRLGPLGRLDICQD